MASLPAAEQVACKSMIITPHLSGWRSHPTEALHATERLQVLQFIMACVDESTPSEAMPAALADV
jgi:hypothetical protein